MKRRGIRKAVVVFALALLCGCRRQETDSEKLLALAPRSERPIDARLTGFDWPEARVQRGPHTNLLDPGRLELAGAASAVIQARSNDSSARTRHEAGAAYLLIDRDRDAIDALESAVRQSPKEAAYWSDLAAARYTLAVREKRPHELPQALADADHALRLQPKLPDALFNRALIIESLGVTEAARRAWQRYVAADLDANGAADPSTHWSTEAMHHLGNLRVVTTRDEFQHHLAVTSRAFRTGNDAPLVALARNYPQEVRTWSEGPLLAKWADAIHKNDAKTAIETLSIVRKLAASLAQFNGVQTVADIVAAIDRADTEHVRILADAHATYRDGRVLYSQRRVTDALAHLRNARGLFDHAGSPMTIITDYYIASCLYDSNRPTEALHALDLVATHFDKHRYPALMAEIGWEQTLCYGALGDWTAAIRTAAESRKTFAALGETINRGQVEVLVADGLDHISQSAGAWTARTAALAALSRAGVSDSIRHALASAINAEAAHGHYDAALALTAIVLDELQHGRLPHSIAGAEAGRAEILAKLGDFDAAQRAIIDAHEKIKEIKDPNLQRRTMASVDLAEASVLRETDPAQSLKLLDATASFLESSHENAWLPKAYLERGRTHVRMHADDAALADFQAGLEALQRQRSSINKSDLGGTFYDISPDLFAETVSLLLRHGNIAHAFSVSDSARQTGTYERADVSASSSLPVAMQIGGALPANTVLIEYAILPESIAIFHLSAKGVGVARVAINAGTLRVLIEHCADLLQRRADIAAVQQDAASLYRLLIAPVAAALIGAEELVIIPDRQLNSIPFAALYDTAHRHYLIDDFAVSVAPSAAFVIQHRVSKKLTPALIVGDPHSAGSPALPEATREAEAIAAIYESSTLLTGDRATRARFIRLAQGSSMIHYAGHAQSDATDLNSALTFAADGSNGTDDLDATDIANLHLRSEPLVILAGCGTIRGESQHVEGMPSVARAFLAAGARGVIGTLWDVDDDSAIPLFRRFHQELRSGKRASSALRAAQIALVHSEDARLRHPSTWAPVELLGR
jgi:CHAT domain-containing protein